MQGLAIKTGTSLVAQWEGIRLLMQDMWVLLGREDSWRKKRQPTSVFLPGKSHGPRSLVGYSPWGRKESDTTERLHFHFQTMMEIMKIMVTPSKDPVHVLLLSVPPILYQDTTYPRLLRVPWTARRSNQSVLKEISPECSLEGLMLKLKLQYFGHLMRRADSLKNTLMLGKVEGGRRKG